LKLAAQLKIAASENRMVVTMDKDFGELVYNSRLPYAGVLLLRLEDARSEAKVKVVEKILTNYQDKISNKFCVYKDKRLRVRR
jgi:predicted nuclease of predicted toxin-antitoxin system